MVTKKLIEVALPLEKINDESAREKSIRKGHPSTLHMWWARRPLATTRAIIWASLVDDPSSHPELFPSEELQSRERSRLFKILENLVVWENSKNKELLKTAYDEILKSTGSNPPALLDPFSGGGAIPLEGQRLGLRVHAHDLNPVAIMINKAMIEIAPRFSNMAPVFPDDIPQMCASWAGYSGLSADISSYGQLLKSRVYSKVGHLYPNLALAKEQGGGKATAIAWIWARTVKCTNPACGCDMPLVSSFVLSKKKGQEAWISPEYQDGHFVFRVKQGKYPKDADLGTKFKTGEGKSKRGTFCCPRCGTGIANSSYIESEANAGRMSSVLMAGVCEGKRGRIYVDINTPENREFQEECLRYYEANMIDDSVPHSKTMGTFASNAQGGYYGLYEFKDYFTKRQLITLSSFSDELSKIVTEIEHDAIKLGLLNDHVPLSHGGTGALAYAQTVKVYLAFAIDKLMDRNSALCSWMNGTADIRPVFARQAIPMVWDYAEANPFSSSVGCWDNMLGWVVDALAMLPEMGDGDASQFNAQEDCGLRNVMISTDPPYYDNIEYADLSDFYYVWLRKNIKDVYPDVFKTMLVPKADELVATPFRFDDADQAKDYFENGMLSACKSMYASARNDIPVTIYYAYKQSEVVSDSSTEKTSSSGWETMLSAIINAGFRITGTWPVRTERSGRPVGNGANALACSIVLVCRKREENAPQTTKKNLINALRRELRPALKKLQDSNIAPVDLAQSAIGPGMGVFSQYRRVLEADGSSMTVRSALQIINEEIDLFFNEQVGSLDAPSRFCVDLYTQCAYNNIKSGEAEVLATAKNTSIAMMASHGVVYAKAGVVHLIERDEMPEKVDTNESNIWMLTQQLTRAMAKGGVNACAEIVFNMFGSNAESAKDLAYRLYTIAERKGWAEEAYAYNNLVVAWPDIQTRAAELKAVQPEQLNMFDLGLLNQ